MSLTADIVVVGGGPAGIAAALSAAEFGARVSLVDDNLRPGGHLRWTTSRQRGLPDHLDDRRGVEIADWAETALESNGVEILRSSIAWGLFDDGLVGVVSGQRGFEIHANAIIIATGATDISKPFPGWDLPGIMLATAVLRFIHLHRVLPGSRFAIVGDGSLASEVASAIETAGGDVIIQVEAEHGVVVGGHQEVEWVDVGQRRHRVDSVVLALGRQPDPELAMQAGCAVGFSQLDGAFVPLRSETLETNVRGIYVVGDAAGTCSMAEAMAEGIVAGSAASGRQRLEEALMSLDRLRTNERRAETSLLRPLIPDAPGAKALRGLREIVPVDVNDEMVICRCEEVSARLIRAAVREGAVTLNDIKRRTRAGMGLCQGVYCMRAIARMLHDEAGQPLEAIEPLTARPPARVVALETLANVEKR